MMIPTTTTNGSVVAAVVNTNSSDAVHSQCSSSYDVAVDDGDNNNNNNDDDDDGIMRIITRPQSGDIITLENLTFTPQDGFVPESLFDLQPTSGIHTSLSTTTLPRITTIVLDGGHYLPGLHDIIRTQCRLHTTISNVPMDAGYGQYRSDLVFHVPIANLQQSSSPEPPLLLKVGTSLRLPTADNNGNGNDVTVRIIDIINNGTIVVLDANSPLAGTSYHCSFTVISIDRLHNPMSIPRNKLILRTNTKTTSSKNNNDEATTTTTTTTAMKVNEVSIIKSNNNPRYQVATFALGCFWGAELAFMRTFGVVGTRVGYTNGSSRKHPTNANVCNNDDNDNGSSQRKPHREAVQIIYDTTIVSYSTLIDIAMERIRTTTTTSGFDLQRLFRSTTNTNGDDNDDDDESEQYRNGIYYHTKEQYESIQELKIADLDTNSATNMEHNIDNTNDSYQQHLLFQPRYNIDIGSATLFWEAEDFHQQYLYKGGQSARKGAKEPIRCYG